MERNIATTLNDSNTPRYFLTCRSSWLKDVIVGVIVLCHWGVIVWVCQENFSLTRLKFSLKMFFVTKKVLINTKLFCNVSNPLNLRYNKQTQFFSCILGNGQKSNFRPLQGMSSQPFREIIGFVSCMYSMSFLNVKYFIQV